MSRRAYLGGAIDRIAQSASGRQPAYRVMIWNPNRCNVQEIVLGRAKSPRYDITPWIQSVRLEENIVFENNDEAICTNAVIVLVRDTAASPIPISERTLLDGTPIRIWSGDRTVSPDDWVLMFTGVIRGNPTFVEYAREQDPTQLISVLAVDRAEKYLNRVVTARSYKQGDDVGKVAVEVAIEHMDLLRREIDFGDQGYAIGHEQSQIVDMAVLPAIAQILFCVGKKPRFDAEGHLVAADTDFDKPAIRIHKTRDLVVSIARSQRMTSIYNSVKLLGLDDELTMIVERVKRLAHGEITAGYFCPAVNKNVYFSESVGTPEGGRKAKDTFLRERLHGNSNVGGNIEWTPWLESDGVTCFGGKIRFDTGYYDEIQAALMGLLALFEITVMWARYKSNSSLAVGNYADAAAWKQAADVAEVVWVGLLIALMVTMTVLGRVEWEVYGNPIQNVFKQLQATAQLDGVLTEDLKELEIRNDWLYDIDVMRARVKQLLRRELAKTCAYEIVMIDDPIVETDDVLEIVDQKFYVTNVGRNYARPSDGLMVLTAWRIG